MDIFFWRAYFLFISERNIEMTQTKEVTTQLGLLCKDEYEKSNERAFKLGVRKIYDALEQKISKRQIKRALQLHVSSGELTRIPYNSFVIYSKLVELVDKDSKLRTFCKNYCENCVNSKRSDYCRKKLLGDFYGFMQAQRTQLNERAIAEILEPLDNFDVKCK